MATVYAIANQKGGVGKTTTAVNVAACIAEAGYETLAGGRRPAGQRHGRARRSRATSPGLYDVLAGDVDGGRRGRPTAIPAPDDARLDARPRGREDGAAAAAGLRAAGCATRSRRSATSFAFTLLDCPPSLGPLTVNALVAADRVIVPVQTEYFALEGLAGLLDTLSLIQRELNPRLTVAGMLLTMHDAPHEARRRTSSARCASISRSSCSTP